MLKRLKNKTGIALLMVISTLMILTSMVVDFLDDSIRNHQITVNYKARVQSYHMAKSAVRFSKLLLFYHKEVESLLSKQGINYADLGYEPLYKLIPISSELMRGLAQMSGDEGDLEEGSESMDDGVERNMGMLESESVKDFLDFDGNFDALIEEEQSKYSLNAVTKMTSTSSTYDLHKKILLSILMRPELKNFFKNQEQDAQDLVHALADFVDSNTTINEFDKAERGRESSVYDDVDYEIKNTAYLTLSEVRLVAGMSDDIYSFLQPLVTVYHNSDQVNVCLAEPEVVEALIVYFSEYSGCTSPLNPDDQDDIDELRDVVLLNCPDKSAITSAVNAEFGITDADTKGTSSQEAACKIKFSDLITDNNTIFRVRATGTVRGVSTTITEVVDVSSSKASGWKTLYFQVD